MPPAHKHFFMLAPASSSPRLLHLQFTTHSLSASLLSPTVWGPHSFADSLQCSPTCSFAQLCSKCFCKWFICGKPLVIVLIEFNFLSGVEAKIAIIGKYFYVIAKLHVWSVTCSPPLFGLPLFRGALSLSFARDLVCTGLISKWRRLFAGIFNWTYIDYRN